MSEQWLPIPSRPGFFASSNGRIKGRSGNVLKQCLTHNGYFYVNASPVTTVNRLVCEAFHGRPPTRMHQAAHRNGVRTDNRPGNLAWLTRRQNYQDQVRHGTDKRGERHHLAKLTVADVNAIREARGAVTQVALAAQYGVRDSAISRIQTGKRWRHL